MPSASHQCILKSPIEHVWSFVSEFDNWAPLLKGYVSHQKLSEQQSLWTLKGEAGRLQRTIQMKVDIIESPTPQEIIFHMSGVTDNVKGSGSFTAEKISSDTTQITGHLTLKAGGVTGAVINPLIPAILSKRTKELAESIRSQIEKREHVALLR
jgi:carbon monoxide dehydrogenase subunit G